MATNETTTKFRVDISDISKAMQEAKRYIAVANSEFKKNASAMDDWRKSTEGLDAKLKQLDSVLDAQNRQLQILESQYNSLTDEQKAGSKAADDLIIKINNQKAAINKTEKEVAQYSDKLKEIKSKSDEAGSGLKGLINQIKSAGDDAEDGAGGFTIMKGALADLVADGIRVTIDALKELATDGSKAYSQFAAATGTATGEMGKWQDAIKTVYNDNFGESLDDVAQKMSIVNQVMRDLSPDEMIKVTEAAMTLEDTFGMDMTETLRGVQSLMTHFGMTSQEALDFISSGAQNGLNYTDELGDNLSEYAGKFAEAGYSAEEYFQLLQNGSDGGAYNLDKVNDAINEVTTRLGDGTIEGSLSMFSTGTQNVFRAWQEGKATQKEVIDSIVGDIQGAKTEQDKMNMSAKAFGTMAEDGGIQFIESMTSVGNAYTDVTGKAKELQNVKYDNVSSAFSGLGRTIKSELLQPILDKIVPVITDFLNWAIDHMNIVLPIVVGLAGAFGVLAGALAIQGIISGVTKAIALLNGTMLANSIVLIVAAIVGLVAALVMLWKKNEAFRNFFIKAWNGIKNAFMTAYNTVKGGLTGLVNAIKELPNKISTWLTNTISKVTSWASNMASKGKQAGAKLVSSVINGVKSLPGKIKSIGGDVVSGLWKGIGNKVEWLKSKIKSFVGNVKDWLKKFFKIGSPSRLMADEIGQWIPAGIGVGIMDNMKSLYSPLQAMGNAVVGDLNNRVAGATGTGAVGGVVNNYNQTINSPKALSRLEIYRQSKNLLGYAGGGR